MNEFRPPTDAEIESELDEESRKFVKRYEDFEPGALPIAPDGSPSASFSPVAEVAPPFASASLCAAGPNGECRHYWRMVSSAPYGNAPGTFEALGIAEPRAHFHTCLVQQGRETELEDDVVFECSRYQPKPLLVQLRSKVQRIGLGMIELLKKEIGR